VSGERSGIRRISDTQRVVSQDTLRQQLQNLPQLLTQAKAVPHMENGQSAGFRVTEIQPDSVFQQLGLEREDVIRAVNGSPVRSVDDAIKAYGNMKTATSFQLDLLRRGQPVTINFSVQ
jgi:general secretion pathway protein C